MGKFVAASTSAPIPCGDSSPPYVLLLLLLLLLLLRYSALRIVVSFCRMRNDHFQYARQATAALQPGNQ